MRCEKCGSPTVEGYFEIDGCPVIGDACDTCKTVENLRTIPPKEESDAMGIRRLQRL